jgi:hypothetical protein
VIGLLQTIVAVFNRPFPVCDVSPMIRPTKAWEIHPIKLLAER